MLLAICYLKKSLLICAKSFNFIEGLLIINMNCLFGIVEYGLDLKDVRYIPLKICINFGKLKNLFCVILRAFITDSKLKKLNEP